MAEKKDSSEAFTEGNSVQDSDKEPEDQRMVDYAEKSRRWRPTHTPTGHESGSCSPSIIKPLP